MSDPFPEDAGDYDYLSTDEERFEFVREETKQYQSELGARLAERIMNETEQLLSDCSPKFQFASQANQTLVLKEMMPRVLDAIYDEFGVDR